jgi:hypothetical protein
VIHASAYIKAAARQLTDASNDGRKAASVVRVCPALTTAIRSPVRLMIGAPVGDGFDTVTVFQPAAATEAHVAE